MIVRKKFMERIGTDTLHFLCEYAILALPLGELSPQVTERGLRTF